MLQYNENMRFIKCLSTISTLKKLSLTVNIDRYDEKPFQYIHNLLRRIFMRTKRINDLDFVVYSFKSKEKIPLKWLLLLVFLRKIKFRFNNFASVSSLVGFYRLIRRRKFLPWLYSQVFDFNEGFHRNQVRVGLLRRGKLTPN